MLDYETGFPNRFSRTEGRIRGAPYGVAYPSPFFDVAHTYLPASIKQMFRWCRYYTLTNPLIAATVNKMSEYPVTDVILDTDNNGVRDLWTGFFEDTLKLRSFMIDVGLFYNCYGNSLVSLSYPFIKFLKCRLCGHQAMAKNLQYKFRGFNFFLDCPKCHNSSEADAFDTYVKSPTEIRLILWNPEDISIRHNELTGKATFYYTLPQFLRNDILLGRRETVETVPQLFIDAVKKEKAIVLSSDNVFHFRKPSILSASRDRGWGIPLILPVLKDTFYLQVLKKAQEAIALERIVPLSVLFPQPGSGTSDPYATISLSKWREQVALEIQRWRFDRNYMPIMPLPIGHQVIGGDGRALLLGQEIRVWSEQIIAGMGVPQEFIFGGLQYSGSNVSLRMLENHFLRYISDLLRMVRTFVIPNVAAFLDWPEVGARFKPFKMADDLQRRAFDFQLNNAGKISDTTLLANCDFDQRKEDELIQKETSRREDAVKRSQIASATVQGEMNLVQAKYQARSQAIMQQEQAQAMKGEQHSAPGEPGEDVPGQQPLPQQQPQQPQQPPQQQPGPSFDAMVAQLVQQVGSAPPEFRQQMLQQIASQNPQLAQAVERQLGQANRQKGNGQTSASKPLPQQLPPRRGSENAII